LATGGYANVFYLSTNARGCNVTAIYRAYKKGAAFANPCYTQIHPTCIPASGEHQSKLTLMSESLRNDGRVWVPKKKGDTRLPLFIPEDERDYYLERKYPATGISRRAISLHAPPKRSVMKVAALGRVARRVFGLRRCHQAAGLADDRGALRQLFDMYETITGRRLPTRPCAFTRPRITPWRLGGLITT